LIIYCRNALWCRYFLTHQEYVSNGFRISFAVPDIIGQKCLRGKWLFSTQQAPMVLCGPILPRELLDEVPMQSGKRSEWFSLELKELKNIILEMNLYALAVCTAVSPHFPLHQIQTDCVADGREAGRKENNHSDDGKNILQYPDQQTQADENQAGYKAACGQVFCNLPKRIAVKEKM